jgi:hypothetical protein
MKYLGNKKELLTNRKAILFFFLCAFIVAILIYLFVQKIPEKNLAKEFLINNQKIIEMFGSVNSISDGTNSSRVFYTSDKTYGFYSFRIAGNKMRGEVLIHWSSKGSGVDFKVDKIEIVEPRKDPLVIWNSEKMKNYEDGSDRLDEQKE